ncbi:TIGR04282 family arsenosugar biosynthesis glycosyltransferase [Parvularcula sp. LCG005]|uniref:TIGR04282 family arsenosugar biosynthesis glycosyltransferase n=1 Tax=Parvularcula sp. LCG005 TaxID=3078805 RepID=UPI0029433A06|nr:TIGR04282 family arsenosugar biosynthesis glycosyltransferase [Parvularcula sp. LCG005]WOI53758.1 TIGR04282 family arsenosugar biosynthesis glycosyltransferase [Parvularcula sp. LCG005]
MADRRRQHLVVMAKPPLAGRVKTRLNREIGTAAAVWFYRHATARLLHRLSKDPRWTTQLAVNASPTARFSCWPTGVQRVSQGQGDLGQRMTHVVRSLPPGPVVIIGTDTPQLELADIAMAFHRLGRDDAVFGPAEDGGYWLIGLARRRPAVSLFDGVRWSTENALSDTIASLPTAFDISTTTTLLDVDTADDLQLLRSRHGVYRGGPWRSGR